MRNLMSLLFAIVILIATSVQAVPPEHALSTVVALMDESPNIVGAGLGLTNTGVPAVVILVNKADVGNNFRDIDGVPVIIKVTGAIFALGKPCDNDSFCPGSQICCAGACKQSCDSEGEIDPTTRFSRPVPIGVSTGHPLITAGTIGCRVTDGTNVWALSNNHVYADENLALLGDSVIQPGTFDGGISPTDHIGTLFDFEPIVFSTSASNVMDAAIALSFTSLVGNSTPSDGYGTPRSTTVSPSLNLRVKKYGRTTSQTSGRITITNFTVNVNYSTGVARFVNQFVVEPGGVSAPGDSGSLFVVDGKGRNRGDDREPVGLLFAGNAFMTVASPINVVLDRFGVTVDGD